jgi:hypothetical protein
MGKKDRLAKLRQKLTMPLATSAAKSMGSMANKDFIIKLMMDAWKDGIRSVITQKGIVYLASMTVDGEMAKAKEQLDTDPRYKTIMEQIGFTEDDLRKAMQQTLTDLRAEYHLVNTDGN